MIQKRLSRAFLSYFLPLSRAVFFCQFFDYLQCVLFIGDTGETIVVRGCALDSGTLTTDTEIIRMSHCGGLYFDERYVYLFERLTTAFDVYHHVPLMTFCHHQATIQPAHQLTRQALMFESRILSCIFFSKGFEYPADRFIVFSLDAANYLTGRFKEYKHHFQSSETRFEPIIVNRYRE